MRMGLLIFQIELKTKPGLRQPRKKTQSNDLVGYEGLEERSDVIRLDRFLTVLVLLDSPIEVLF